MSPRSKSTTVRSETGRVRHRHHRPDQGGQGMRPVGPGRVRPELRWEVIDIPGGGRYVVRREPAAYVLLPAADAAQTGTGGVLVVDTHDLQLAATTAWPRWCEYVGGRLPVPRVGWWRSLPADPQTGEGVERMWWPARPGSPGAVPAVEWPAPPSAPPSGPPSGPPPWPWLGGPACDGGGR